VADREEAGKEQIRTASSMAEEVEKLGMANRELELSSEKLNKELADLENENELAAAEVSKKLARLWAWAILMPHGQNSGLLSSPWEVLVES